MTPVFAAEQRKFDIPADSANVSVAKFARQAGLSVMYEAGRLKGFRTGALQGSFEPLVALTLLLKDSGLQFTVSSGLVISVNPERSSAPTRASTGPENRELPVVHVPGWMSRSSSMLPAGVSLERVTAADLATAGVSTVVDWARTLPQNQGSGASEDTTHGFLREAITNTAYGSGMNLYGIGSRATLILVNGRRLAPSGSAGTFTDISNIPITAIDHIDVISDGAAALYGADAVGGIVNFVLHGALSETRSDAVIGHLVRGSLGEKEFSQSLSRKWRRGGGVLSLEYYSRDALPASERRQATSDLTQWGGSNFNNLAGNPGTILDSQGRIWGIPTGQDGSSLTPAQLIAAPNRYDREAGTWVLPRQGRFSLLASATHQLADDSSLFFDALLNRRWVKTQDAPLSTILSVPSSNAFYVNPVDGNKDPLTVLYGFGKDLGPIRVDGRVDSGQLAGGVNRELTRNWNIRAYVGYTFEHQHDVEHGLVNFGVLQDYLGRKDPTTAFNPFGDGSNTAPSTLKAIRADGWLDFQSAFRSANVSATGVMPFLPAGPTTLTIGYDYRIQSFRTGFSPSFSSANLIPTPATNRDRTVSAVFLQSSTPVLSPDVGTRWPVRLDMSAGVRYEHFSDAGQGVMPTFGFEFSPHPSVTLKGTWARLFRPPNLPDLNESPNISEIFPLADPTSAAGFTPALVVTGNNSALHPETSHSWTLGVAFAPVSNPNLTLTGSYFNIVSSNRIVALTPLPLTVLADPRYSYVVDRTVTSVSRADVCTHSQFIGDQAQCLASDVGAIVDLRLHNMEKLEADGLDLSARYGRDTAFGVLGINIAATYFLHYREAQTPGDPLVEYRNTDHNPPALRLRGLFNWEHRGYSVSPAINFQSGYTDVDSLPQRPVSSWMTWDLVLGYKLRPFDSAVGGETTVSLRGQNVFNKQPPFLNNSLSSVGYDPENGDLLGRRVSFAVQHRW
ncbi:MAG: TonB-dependent receptor domain-containing protein [Steroidobacteraceae bacterium]